MSQITGSSCNRTPKRRFHALRYAIAVHLLDASVDVACVQDRLGHANIQNTMVSMRDTTVTRDAQTRQLFASHRVVCIVLWCLNSPHVLALSWGLEQNEFWSESWQGAQDARYTSTTLSIRYDSRQLLDHGRHGGCDAKSSSRSVMPAGKPASSAKDGTPISSLAFSG